MNKQKILVSGSLAYDKIMDFNGQLKDHIMMDKVHKLSVSFMVNKLKINFGGTAGNIAYNLKLLDLEPIIISQAGDDFLNYKKWLLKNKISLEQIKIIKNKNTATAYIITDKVDNQITALHLETMGVPVNINQQKIKKIGKVDLAIVSPGNKEDMLKAVKVYKKMGIAYIADPGQQIPVFNSQELNNFIKGARVLIVNDYEFDLIRKKITKTQKQIEKMVEILVITYGSTGSKIFSNNKMIKIKAVQPQKIADPTGAGDAYRAGLIKGLIEGWELKKSGELAAWVAKHAVEHYGTQEHKFKYKVDFKG